MLGELLRGKTLEPLNLRIGTGWRASKGTLILRNADLMCPSRSTVGLPE